MAAQLTLQDVSLQFGGIKVLQEVSFAVEPGQIFGLVGPNGAGKTSLFNCISGHYKPTAGTVRINNTEVQGARPARLARHGLARTFQHPALQLHETVLENVLLGAHTRLPGGAPRRRCAPRRWSCWSATASAGPRTCPPTSCPTACTRASSSAVRCS
jgi:branched-chain amino acid transport system ATP-binding protein